ncbi:hypothetical protein HY640_01865 [Candidatus Woesearchaeota archaeon]|nr:hypothetical protein [Candidatus Woesearchaeota archaeon]
MKITIDTEKDSKEEIQAAIQLLRKTIGDELQREEPRHEPLRTPETSSAEELIKKITSGKLARSPPSGEEIKGVPKSIREAYDLSEKFDTY